MKGAKRLRRRGEERRREVEGRARLMSCVKGERQRRKEREEAAVRVNGVAGPLKWTYRGT